MSSIHIEVYEVEVLGIPTGAGHLYLVYDDGLGQEFVIRGGPSGIFSSTIVTENGVPIEQSLDAREGETPGDRQARKLDLTGREAADVWHIMVQQSQNIDDEEITYNTFTQNSNSVISSILNVVGLAPFDNMPSTPLDLPGNTNALPFDYTLTGTDGDDIIQGQRGNDLFAGLSGDDSLSGNSGNDTLNGGGGKDSLSGGADNDLLLGARGADSLLAGAGNDTLRGDGGADTLQGGQDNDHLDGGKKNDLLRGGNGADTLMGGNGADTLTGGDNQDRLHGGNGHDVLYGSSGPDQLLGGVGNDTLVAQGDDEATGGTGEDVFVLTQGTGTIIVLDFTPGVDKLSLDGLDVSDLSFEDDKIFYNFDLLATLTGVETSTLTEADFLALV